MVTFDLPIPDTTVGRRNQSNVPAQALALMNDPFVHGQSAAWARRLLSEAGIEATERIQRLYLQALARNPTSDEVQTLLNLLAKQTRPTNSTPPNSKTEDEVRLWTEICHALFLTQEFSHVP